MTTSDDPTRRAARQGFDGRWRSDVFPYCYDVAAHVLRDEPAVGVAAHEMRVRTLTRAIQDAIAEWLEGHPHGESQ